MNHFRFLWLAVFALFVGTASYLAEDILFPKRIFPSGSLEHQIHEDFRSLKEKNQLPKGLFEIHQVFLLDNRIHKTDLKWTELVSKTFPQKPEGQYDLQIEIFDTLDSKTQKPTADNSQIIQYSLFERKSRNKLWELSRRYTLPTSNIKP